MYVFMHTSYELCLKQYENQGKVNILQNDLITTIRRVENRVITAYVLVKLIWCIMEG